MKAYSLHPVTDWITHQVVDGITYQVVDGIVRPHLAAVDEALGEGGHDVLHEEVAQGHRLGLQHLVLLAPHLGQSLDLQHVQHAINSETNPRVGLFSLLCSYPFRFIFMSHVEQFLIITRFIASCFLIFVTFEFDGLIK